MNDEKLFLFLSILESVKRRRTGLYRALLTSHENMLRNIVRRRRATLRQMSSLHQELPINFFTINVPRFREIHRRQRFENYWGTLQQPENENMFFESLRMSSASFNILYEKLMPYLETSEFFITAPIPKQVQVAMCLYKLASCSEYRVVGDVFGFHKSTVHKYFHKVVEAIIHLQHEFLEFPTLEEAIEIAKGFQDICKIPNLFGAIDGTHIPVLPPSEGYLDYINRKGWPSIVMQAVVDNKYLFRDVSIKFPGSTHDATVFKESGLFQNSDKLIPKYSTNVSGVETPLMLVGDPAYPLLPWVIKPFVGSLTAEEESFNCYLSTGRIVVENAFGRLKARWRCLQKRLDVDPSFVPKVALACAILHNFVEKNKEKFLEAWIDGAQNEGAFQQPSHNHCFEVISENNVDPKYVRNNLKIYMAENYPLRNSNMK